MVVNARDKERDDIQQLKVDVAVIKLEQGNQTKTLNDVNEKLSNLAFLSQKDYDGDFLRQGKVDEEQDKRLTKLEEMVFAGGVANANKLSTGVSKAILSALVFGILSLLVWSLLKVTPALGGLQ